MHLTLKIARELPNLRRRDAIRTIERQLFAANGRFGLRIAQYCVQKDHLHLVCEATGRDALSRGMQGMSIRIARALNRLWQRKGSLFADRYHAHILKTPREVKNCLSYVLNNARRHGKQRRQVKRVYPLAWADPCSSARWFDGFRGVRPERTPDQAPVAAPRTWLLRVGWRRHGLLALDAIPGTS